MFCQVKVILLLIFCDKTARIVSVSLQTNGRWKDGQTDRLKGRNSCVGIEENLNSE